MSIAGTMSFERVSSATPDRRRIVGIDELRGVSILIVLLGHGSSTRDSPALFAPLRNMGIVGVELFFAISGFVITLLLMREWQRDGGVSLQKFWARRALRILPPFFAASATIGLVSAFGVMQWWWGSFFGALTFTKNLPLLGGDWFFGHFWSLSVEEQFYLFWPLLFVWLIGIHRIQLALGLLIVASPVFAVLCTHQLTVLQNLLPYIPYLATGALLAVMLEQGRGELFATYITLIRWRGIFLLLLITAAIACSYLRHNQLWADETVPLDALLMPAAIFFILLESIGQDGLVKRALDFAPLRGLGLISYSTYLWQQIFLGPPDVYASPWFWSQWPQNIVAAIGCGVVGYYGVERPSARLRARFA